MTFKDWLKRVVIHTVKIILAIGHITTEKYQVQ